MNLDNQLMFFFSALGAFNGLLLAVYFAFFAQKKQFSNYFLALLLFTLSIRIIKSVFFYFNPNLSGIFIQIGLSGCILIGPFLYLYLRNCITNNARRWGFHIFPFLLSITILGIIYPYVEHSAVWSKYIVCGIYVQWLLYIIGSFRFVKPAFQKLIQKKEKLTSIDIWLLSIFVGVFLIWLAYNIASYTSYIVGAISFSFVLYLMILLFVLKIKKNTSFFEEKEKYKNKAIDHTTIEQITQKINIIKDKELYLNPNLTLSDTAKELEVSQHNLSQFLNNNLNISFTLFINELRIEKAKELLSHPNLYTIEAIGYESGFKSKSTFFTAFKKITSQTPLEFQKTKK
ncbi:helix-turn-helix domain-containing protein [Flavobacterium sp. NPDC079362]|uniref:helix-turn-helix domain-containing protein n=1 Tax=Flavobacterium sp. NPDC079362 TaxID=3390566 RepID=UPI003D014DDA